MARFLDTNILLRYFANDDPAKSPAALALLQRVERGDERVVMTAIVVFEVVFTLQRSYKLPKAVIRQELGKILSLLNLQLTEKTLCRKALDLYLRRTSRTPTPTTPYGCNRRASAKFTPGIVSSTALPN